MRQHLDDNDVVNSIRLELRHPSGKNHVWLLVEGETDQKLFSKLVVDGGFVKVESVPGGVRQLRIAVSVLMNETDRVLGIRDADFFHLDGKGEDIESLFLTDYHDVEMMLISCDEVFKSVVLEYFNSHLDNFDSLRSELLESISFLGGIKWLNDSEDIGLNFKGLGLNKFYDVQSLKLDPEFCIQIIHERSPDRTRDVCSDDVSTQIGRSCDYLNFCSGHDFEKAFALYATELNTKGVKHSDIGKALRVAYRKEDFSQTQLFLHLKGWEEKRGYNLL